MNRILSMTIALGALALALAASVAPAASPAAPGPEVSVYLNPD